LIRILKLHYLRYLGYIFVIRMTSEIYYMAPKYLRNRKSDILLRHPTFP